MATERAFAAISRDEAVLRPAVDQIARDLGLDPAALTRYPAGSRPVYAIGDAVQLRRMSSFVVTDRCGRDHFRDELVNYLHFALTGESLSLNIPPAGAYLKQASRAPFPQQIKEAPPLIDIERLLPPAVAFGGCSWPIGPTQVGDDLVVLLHGQDRIRAAACTRPPPTVPRSPNR